jgi:hypothetical protein
MELMAKGESIPSRAEHPIELFARAYGIAVDGAATAERQR